MTTVTGNTYPVRAQLASMGGRWNQSAQGWTFLNDAVADEAQTIVNRAGPAPARAHRGSRTGRRYGSSYTRFAGGGESYRNARGRCEDAPCCGCCS